MSFTSPELLYSGAIVALLVILGSWSQALRRGRFADFLGGGRAVKRLSWSNLYGWRIERVILLGGAAAALAAAAAGPIWRAPPVEPPPEPIVRSVMLAIDVSGSMQASDVVPNRLARGVEVARQLLAALPEERVGLLIFAGAAYPLAPPTHDHRVISFLLDGVAPSAASAHDPGTRISAGLESAITSLSGPADSTALRSVVLISDGDIGEAAAAVTNAAEQAAEREVSIYSIGVGTEGGAGMVMPTGPYQLGGPIVTSIGTRAISRLRPPLLRRAAELGGGEYALASDQPQIDALLAAMERPPEAAVPELTPPVWARYDLTFWFTVFAIIGLLVESLLDSRLPRIHVPARRRLA